MKLKDILTTLGLDDGILAADGLPVRSPIDGKRHGFVRPASSAEVTAAIDTKEIWLMPLVNPDGHVHALKGEDWRKNANNATGGKRS